VTVETYPVEAAPVSMPSGGVLIADPVERHFQHRGHGAEFEMEAGWVRRQLPKDARRVLDVGCGNGALFEAMGPQRVVGIDRCADGLGRTRQRFRSTPLVCADAATLPLRDGAVDAVTSQHVIEHLPKYAAACAEWRRVLAAGGVLLVLTPNVEFVDPAVFEDETHVHLFDKDDLADTLIGAGFEIVELCSLGLPWFRNYQSLPSGWRFRRLITRRSTTFSTVPFLKWRGQTLCCAARRVDV